MENKRAVIISVICFTVALLLISAYVSVRRYELTQEFGELVPVVVAASYVDEYRVIRPEDLTVIEVFKKFRQPEAFAEPNDVIGKAAFIPLYRDEQILPGKLIHQDGRPLLDRQVEKKMRAVTIPISPFTGVGRLIRPGNRVDIIASPNYETRGTTIYEVKTMFQNVLVLATGRTIQNAIPTRVDREVLSFLEDEFEKKRRRDLSANTTEGLHTSRPDDNYSHITVQLSTDDAEKLLFLTHTFGDARLYFTLRNGADPTAEKLETTLLDDVLGPESDYGLSKRKPPPPPPPPQPKFYDSIGGRAEPRY